MSRNHVCFIVPPHVLVRAIDEGSPQARAAAIRTLALSERVRERRAITRRLVQHQPEAAAALLLPPAGEQRVVDRRLAPRALQALAEVRNEPPFGRSRR